MPLPGRFVVLELDERFVCRCGAVKFGDTVGKRGGRQWAWLMPDGAHKYCSRECAHFHEDMDAAQESGLAEYEAEQAMRAHGARDDGA